MIGIRKEQNLVKLLIFDWDDVFSIGSKEGYYKCFQMMLDELGIEMTHNEMKKRLMPLWGKPYPNLLKNYSSKNLNWLRKAAKFITNIELAKLFSTLLT